MWASSGDWSFYHAGVDGMILTCQGSFPGCICGGRSVTCPCTSGYDVSGSKIYYDDRVSLIGQFSCDSLKQMTEIIAVVALCLRAV